MKDYFLFATEGNPVKITKENGVFTLIVEQKYTEDLVHIHDNRIFINLKDGISHPRFTKEALIDELQKLVKYVQKYG